MPLVKPEDVTTELYQDVIDEITRNNPEEVKEQIKAAEDYAKGYLFKYDLLALFGSDTEEPTHPDANLKKVIKVIASYWLVRKASPGASLSQFRDDWQLLIGTRTEPGWLTDVKEGRVNPEWPYKPDDPITDPNESTQNNDVYWQSNIKRTNSF